MGKKKRPNPTAQQFVVDKGIAIDIKESVPTTHQVKCVMCWTLTPVADVEYGKALGCSGAFCSDCKGWLTDYEFSSLDGEVEGNIPNTSTVLKYIQNPTSTDTHFQDGTPYPDPWDDGTPSYHQFSWNKLCQHNLTPYKLPQGVVYLSGYSALVAKKRQEGPNPQAAIYLTWDWMNHRIVSNHGALALPDVSEYMEFAYVGWPDHGVVPLEVIHRLVNYSHEKITAGINLEIACYGGHGRTGTLAACIGVKGGWTAAEAIDNLRTNYCVSSIESVQQEDLILNYWKEINGLVTDNDNPPQVV